MEPKDKKTITDDKWKEMYPSVVREITTQETPTERQIKNEFYERFMDAFNGRDMIIQNYCK